MNALVQPQVSIINNVAKTTSIAVADFFKKLHKNVLKAIDNLKADLDPVFYALNFELIQNQVDLGMGRTRLDRAYEMTKDGFTLLALGFTGKEALAFKVAYINRFNEMEAALKTQQPTQPELPTPPQNPRLLLRNTIHAVAKGDRQTYSNLYNRLYRKFQVTSYKELNDNQCVAAIEFIKSVQGEYIPRDKIEAPKPTFALADGQHYIVVKDGEPLYRYLLSSEVTDSCLKTMQQPTLNLQGLDLLKGEVDYWQVRKALNVLNSLIYQYQPYNHVKPVFNIISAAENMLCRLWAMIDESSTRLGYLQAVAKTGKPLDEANMDTLAYIQVALANRMMKVQMPLC